MSTIPRKPADGAGWEAWMISAGDGWKRGDARVLSSIDHREGTEQYYHVACVLLVDGRPKRATDRVVQGILADFDMIDAEEETRTGGAWRARHFWKAVDR